MKILIVSPASLNAVRIGGPITTIGSTCRALDELGCKVDVVSTTLGLNSDEVSSMDLGRWRSPFVNGNIREITYKYFGYSNLTFSPSVNLFFIKNIKKYDFVIFQSVWNYPCFSNAMLCLMSKIPYMVIPHGTLSPSAWLMKSAKYKNLMYFFFIKKFLESAVFIQFTVEEERRNVLDFIDAKVETLLLANPVDTYWIDSASKTLDSDVILDLLSFKESGFKIILFMGRIARVKGLDILIKAVSQLKSKGVKFKLVLAGPNDGYQNELEYLIRLNGLVDDVVFTGLVDGYCKVSLYHISDLFVLSSYSENFGMSVVEAMNSNVPVVISNKVGLSDKVSEYNAGLVCPLDPFELSHSIIKLLDDIKLREIVKVNSKAMIQENFDSLVVNRILLDRIRSEVN